MRLLKSLAAALLLVLAVACTASGPADLGYDPKADPTPALATARAEAARSGKSVLVIAGGDWCRWCHVLDRFLAQNDDVKAELDDTFVTLKVYYGDENTNDAFFAQLPEAEGYPHFWVVTPGGNRRSVGTATLESGDDDYDKDLFLAFVRKSRRSPATH